MVIKCWDYNEFRASNAHTGRGRNGGVDEVANIAPHSLIALFHFFAELCNFTHVELLQRLKTTVLFNVLATDQKAGGECDER